MTPNDTDIDGDILTIIGVSNPSNGTVVLNPDGTVTFTPTLNYHGPATFDYEISDGNGGSDTATVTVNVAAVNDPPVAVDDTAVVAEDTPLILGVADIVTPNDTDIDGDILTITGVSNPSNGMVVLNPDGTVTFTPTLNYHGPATFEYEISDGNGGSDTATVNLTVTPVQDPPVGVDDLATTDEDTPIFNLPILDNDTDPDGDVLSVQGTPTAPNGTVTVNSDGTINYAPDLNFNGTDTITYVVTDGNGNSDTATVTVTVNPVNDGPVAEDDTIAGTEDVALVLGVADIVTPNDTDVEGDTLTITGVSNPSNGTVVLNPDGTVTFTPTLNYNGPATFEYEISDGNGGSDTATVTVNVAPVNDPPVAVNDIVAGMEDTDLVLGVADIVTPNDTDLDGDRLTITEVSNPSNGTVVLNPDGTVTFTPTLNYHGPATFDYEISDGNGGSDTATVTVNVAAVNDAPDAKDDVGSGEEDNPITGNVLSNDSDVDGDTPLTVVSNTAPSNGTLVIGGNGDYTYTPTLNFNGTDSFTYTVQDPGGATDTATVNLTVTPVQDPPVGVDDLATTDEDTPIFNLPILDNDTDPDGDVLSVQGTPTAPNGTVTVNSDGTINYAPDLNFNGTDTITYVVTDGNGNSDTATVTVTVNPVNDPPVAVTNINLNNQNIGPVIIDLADNDTDIDGDLDLTSVDLDPSQAGQQTTLNVAGEGIWTVDDSAVVTFTPDPALDSQPTPITYTIKDVQGSVSNEAKIAVDYYVGDIWFGNDESGSVDDTEFPGGRELIADIASKFTFGPASGNIGLNAGLYGWSGSSSQEVQVSFSDDSSFSNSVKAVGRSYDGSTDVGAAIQYGIARVLATGRSDAQKTLVILTDARDDQILNDSSLLNDAAQAKAAGIKLVIIAIDEATESADALAKLALAASNDSTGNPLLISADDYSSITAATVASTVESIVAARLTEMPPILLDDDFTGDQDTPLTLDVLGNDVDVNGEPLALDSVTQPGNGSVTINPDGTVVYTPNTGFSGQDTFTYTAITGGGVTETATVTVSVLGAVPPVVIDLDGDGAEFSSIEDGIAFDVDADGVDEQTAWAGNDDGVLVYDHNQNNEVDDRSEIAFADYSDDANATDLEGLAFFDSDGNGALDSGDEEFANFKIWQDADGDGQVGEGELKTLTEHGIESIGLTGDDNGRIEADDDVFVHGESEVKYTDGSTGIAADAQFKYEELAVSPVEDETPIEIQTEDGELLTMEQAPADAIALQAAPSADADSIGAAPPTTVVDEQTAIDVALAG